MRIMKEMLNNMDEKEFRKKAKDDFVFFCARVLGLQLSTFHLEQLEMLNSRYVCIVSPRGHLKTTLFAIAYPLWRIWKDENVEICLISSAIDQSKKTLEKAQSMIEDNEILNELKSKKNQWNSMLLACNNGSRYFIKPLNSTIRGTHVDCCICDDILRENNSERASEIFWSVIFPIVQTKRGQLIITGTPTSENDLLSEIEKKSGWSFRRWSAITEGKPLWPERFNLEELKSIKDVQGEFKFNVEYMCDVTKPTMQSENIFIGRKNEVRKIITSIKKGRNILITGPLGIGKTSLLTHIMGGIENSVYFGSGDKRLLKTLCIKANIPAKKRHDVKEIIGMLKTDRIVLLLDDVNDATFSLSKELSLLSDCLIIVAAGEEEPKYERLSWLFKERIRLKPFGIADMEEFIIKRLNIKIDKWCARKMFWITKGMPSAVSDFTSELKIKLAEGKRIENAIDNIRPHPSVCAMRIDVFPAVGIITIAYLLLAMRYVGRMSDNTELYLFSGMIGFILLAMVRFVIYRKRRKQK